MEQTLIVKQFDNQLLKSCSYLIEGEFLLLIDPGDWTPIEICLNETRKALKAVILTHCHADHIYGLSKLIKKYPYTPVFCSRLTSEGLFDIRNNLSFLFPEHPLYISQSLIVNVIKEGHFFIDSLMIKVLETPGHSNDCLSFIIGNHIFTGDSYIPFSKVFTKWPSSQKDLAVINEKRLIELINTNHFNVHPGHWQ